MIINLTQYVSTKEQVQAGVVDVGDRVAIKAALSFESLPTRAEIQARAHALVDIAEAEGADCAMIGGATYLMAPLESALAKAGIQPLYSFTEHRLVEETLPNGEVEKTSVFRHAGWVRRPCMA
jgi:phosphoribosylamine-glycine ligase